MYRVACPLLKTIVLAPELDAFIPTETLLPVAFIRCGDIDIVVVVAIVEVAVEVVGAVTGRTVALVGYAPPAR